MNGFHHDLKDKSKIEQIKDNQSFIIYHKTRANMTILYMAVCNVLTTKTF